MIPDAVTIHNNPGANGKVVVPDCWHHVTLAATGDRPSSAATPIAKWSFAFWRSTAGAAGSPSLDTA